MPRPRLATVVQKPPRIKGFTPVGFYGDATKSIVMNIEEYEAIRLLDYEHLSQLKAAECMNVSRPTLTRIYERARLKIATALTEVLPVIIEGGTALFSEQWITCLKCEGVFNNPTKAEINGCVICGHSDLTTMGGEQ